MTQLLDEAALPSVQHSDGSAAYSHNGYTILATVNGPIEAQRRDELPEEAVVDVVVRPAAGFGGVREKYLGTLVQSVLRHVILVSAHPRNLIQITLQVISTPEHALHYVLRNDAGSDIALLPAFLQTSLLALLSSSVPLLSILIPALIAVDRYGTQKYDPSVQQAQTAASLHVFCFTPLGDLLLTQSAGHFSIEAWETALNLATARCRGKHIVLNEQGERPTIGSIEVPNLEHSLKAMVQKQVSEQQRWKGSQT